MSDIDIDLIDGDRFEVTVLDDGFEIEVIEGEEILIDVLAEGVQGPAGTAGPGGFDYVHTQSLAASTWVIVHNLGGYPNVTTVDSLGRVFEAQVTYDSLNQITVGPMSPATAGSAFLS